MKSLLHAQTTRIIFRLVIFAALLLTAFANPQPAAAVSNKCYVDKNAPGINSGTSWTDAYLNLQSALNNLGCTEIWVADGLYKPGSNYTDTFQILPHVEMYGGFGGYGVNETTRDQRDPDSYITVLSGDVDNNDTTDAQGVVTEVGHIHWTDTSWNALHVVTMHAVNSNAIDILNTTVLDGFTITAGYASGQDYDGYPRNGGGLACLVDNSRVCNPTLRNLVFSGNRANGWGGALYNEGSTSLPAGNPKTLIRNVIFTGNVASNTVLPRYSTPYNPADPDQGLGTGMSFGGAMSNFGSPGWCDPDLEDVTFKDNFAETGGGAMANYADAQSASPTLSRVTFDNNHTTYYGGAIYNSASSAGRTSMVLKNVTFYGNSAVDGGAIYNFHNNDLSATTYNNVTFSGNSASGRGGALYYRNNRSGWLPQIKNTIFWGDSALNAPEIFIERYGSAIYGPTFSNSVIQGSGGSSTWNITFGTNGGGNLDTDPVLGSLQDNGGLTRTMALLPGSSAIDQGSACETTDQRGATRPMGAGCDIGAFEFGFFSKLLPADGAVGVGVTPADLAWEDVTHTGDYSYCYDFILNDTCDDGWISESTHEVLIDGLAGSTTYEWQVKTVISGIETYANAGSFQTFTTVATDSGDSFEDDDTYLSATPILNGDTQSHSILPVYDEDWFSFHLEEKSGITLLTDGEVGGDTVLFLYAGDGKTILDSDDDGAAVAFYSQIDRLCGVDGLAGGDYFVKVRHPNLASGTVPAYTLSLTITDCFNYIFPYISKPYVPPPDDFSMLSPSNESNGNSINLTFDWEDSSGADTYQYCFDNKSSGPCDGTWYDTDTSSQGTPPEPLLNNRVYRWQARATGPGGTTYANGGGMWIFGTEAWTGIMSENFEGGFPAPTLTTGLAGNSPGRFTGWMLNDKNGATDGEYYPAKSDCRPFQGSYSAWMIAGGANGSLLTCPGSVPANYPDNADAWMTYGPFSTQGLTRVIFDFYFWTIVNPVYDRLCAYVSTDGTTFSPVRCMAGGDSGFWSDNPYNFEGVYLNAPAVWIAFGFQSNGDGLTAAGGAFVDNITVVGCNSGSSCPGGGG